MEATLMPRSLPVPAKYLFLFFMCILIPHGTETIPVMDQFQFLDEPLQNLDRNLMFNILHHRLQRRQVSEKEAKQTTTTTTIPDKTTTTVNVKPTENVAKSVDLVKTVETKLTDQEVAPGSLTTHSSKSDLGQPSDVIKIPTSPPDIGSNVNEEPDLSQATTALQITSLTGDRAGDSADSSSGDIKTTDSEVKIAGLAAAYPITSTTQPDINSDTVNEKHIGVNPANPQPNTTTQAVKTHPVITTTTTSVPLLLQPVVPVSDSDIKIKSDAIPVTEAIKTTTTSVAMTTSSLPSTKDEDIPAVPENKDLNSGDVFNNTTEIPTAEMKIDDNLEMMAPPPKALNNATDKPIPVNLKPENFMIPNTTTTQQTTTTVSMTTDYVSSKVLNETHFEHPPAAIMEPLTEPPTGSNNTTRATDISSTEGTTVPSMSVVIPKNETEIIEKESVAGTLEKESLGLAKLVTVVSNTTAPDNVATETTTESIISVFNITTFQDSKVMTTMTVENITTESGLNPDGVITVESNETMSENVTGVVSDSEIDHSINETVYATTTTLKTQSAENVTVVPVIAPDMETNSTEIPTTTESINVTTLVSDHLLNVTNLTTTLPTTTERNATVAEVVVVTNKTTEIPLRNNNVTEATKIMNTTTDSLYVTNKTITTTEAANLTEGPVVVIVHPLTTTTVKSTVVANKTVAKNTTIASSSKTTQQNIPVIVTKLSTPSTTVTTTTVSKSTEPAANASSAVGQPQGLSASAMTAFITGSIIGFWIILGPIICLICKVRDKRKERYHTRLTNHSDPPADNGMLDAMIISELKKTSESSHDNGTTREKEKEYKTVANDKGETEKLKTGEAEHEF